MNPSLALEKTLGFGVEDFVKKISTSAKYFRASYKPKSGMVVCELEDYVKEQPIPIERVLLDPASWVAVGKSEGWGNHNFDPDSFRCLRCGEAAEYARKECFEERWKYEQHRFIDALNEQYLTTNH